MSAAQVGEIGESDPRSGRLALPDSVNPRRIVWPYAIAIVVFHLAALLAFVPWFFSWSGVIVAIVGVYIFGGLGINVCYHRLLTHRGFVCWKPLEYTFAVIGVCCLQDSPARWIAVHRRHHEHSDEPMDPHSPRVSFLWSHVGWMLVEHEELERFGIFERYAKDIIREPFYKWLERRYGYVLMTSWILFFAAGFAVELAFGGSLASGVQYGLSILVWGVIVRTVVVWHITWSVNSLAHMWGYRNYATNENSRNNVFVAIITSGEGWHNNHHADQRSARHGHKWYELDGIYLVIRFLALIGAARHVKTPRVPASLQAGNPG